MTTKIHVVVDAIGRLIQGRLTAGQVHGVTQAQPLLRDVPARCVVADEAYDAGALRQTIDAAGAKAVIPRALDLNSESNFNGDLGLDCAAVTRCR